jgi:hypothetical protein
VSTVKEIIGILEALGLIALVFLGIMILAFFIVKITDRIETNEGIKRKEAIMK